MTCHSGPGWRCVSRYDQCAGFGSTHAAFTLLKLRDFALLAHRAVDQQGDQDHRAINRVLGGAGNAQQRQSRRDTAQQQDAQHSSRDRADTAIDRHAADDHSGDHLELKTISGVGRVNETPAAGIQNARQAGQCAGYAENQQASHA